MINKLKIPIGVSDFKDMVTGNYCYIDKSLFIKEILDRGDKVILIPRPRRFGKTLNLSMLKYFFDCGKENKKNENGNSNKHLFNGLAISNEGDEYLKKMGKHPVIFITFKDIKESDWNSCLFQLKQLIHDVYLAHDYLLESDILKPTEKDFFQCILDLKEEKGYYENSLKKLVIFLNQYYGEHVVVLIDEYDMPIHGGYNNDYYDEIINFMRNFLSGGLKDMDLYLKKGVLTGIMRIASDSIFSGLNNLGVYSLVRDEFNDKFGFTEKEVESLLKDFELPDMYNDVQRWYNGYKFGSRVIYNPWSIINFLASSEHLLEPYWINTSDNKIIESLMSKGGKELRKELEQLIRKDTIEKNIDENLILKDLEVRDDLLWSFLLMSGYLKQTSRRRDDASGKVFFTLSIPNEEVKFAYTGIIDRFFSTKIENEKLEMMLKGLIDGNVLLFERMMQEVMEAIFSYHDLSKEPEKVYHAFVIGLLVWISGTHEIKSNRESGYGRYDVLIIPKMPTKTGYVIEFKKVDKRNNETVEIAINSALKQIEEKKYVTELIDRGIKDIKKLAIVFSGKEVFVKENNQGND